tara:strand:+ start:411 stop:602 length:192 start_codon:yes stop_codon:yes gene_type:complete
MNIRKSKLYMLDQKYVLICDEYFSSSTNKYFKTTWNEATSKLDKKRLANRFRKEFNVDVREVA